jgi:hypothetical protein
MSFLPTPISIHVLPGGFRSCEALDTGQRDDASWKKLKAQQNTVKRGHGIQYERNHNWFRRQPYPDRGPRATVSQRYLQRNEVINGKVTSKHPAESKPSKLNKGGS